MGSHRQSFQCFDAILDDPSLKPSLPYGHRSVASHMSSPASNRLEALEDRGCYLCADHQQATSMTSEASGAYTTPWYHFQTHPHSHHYMTRRPARPEESTGEFEDHHHHHHKHSSRIVIVKNSDPSVQRTIVLHRRSLRSFGLFMDEVSQLMQCLIRKLYTLDGNKVDSVQSLLHCAGILVCVGREPFHPLLLDSFRKNSYDKLPKLNIKSRSSAGSDDNGAKKNVDFGLETKRSIIHPRCDSSNRCARLASSEKLFSNGLNSMPPGNAGTCPRAREGMMDDDIEKRVLVNKDGSLSMEMKVRFRLLHDETLHWSTEIKKSTSTLNECHTAHDDAYCLSHGSTDSCSEVESPSACEAEETYNTKRYQKHFEEPHCYHCCAQCQEYDMRNNPILPDQTAVRHIKSSSSSASSRKIVCKKASTDSMHTMSSEEYTEHVVEKVEQTFGKQNNTSIKHCTTHCCCRQSQVRLVSAKPKCTGSTEQKYKVPEKMEVSDTDENKPDNSKDSQKEKLIPQIAQPVVKDERPLSTVSSSSHILASLKEDQDEEDVDILGSISRASLDSGQQEDEDGRDAESNQCSATHFRSLASMKPLPPNKTSPLGRPIVFRKLTSIEIDVDRDDQNVRAGSAESDPSEALSGPKKCKCSHLDDTENNELMANDQEEEDAEIKIDKNTGEIREGTHREMLAKCKTSSKSPSKLSLCSQDDLASENTEGHQDITDERSSSSISIKSNTSDKSDKSNVAELLEQECPVHDERAPSAISIESHKSENSKSEMSETSHEDQENEVRTSSATSGKSTTSVKSKRSKISENNFDDFVKLHDNVEDRTMSPMSCKSNISANSSRSKEPQSEENKSPDELIEERASSVKSAMSNRSVIEEFKDQTEGRASSAISLKSNTSDRSKTSVELSELEEHELDRVSVDSHISQKSNSEISEASSLQIREEEELQERTPSAMSATSLQSLKTTLSDVQPTTVEPHNGQPKERAQSVMSTKSSASVKVDAPEVESELPRERSPNSMSSMSHISAISKVSEDDEKQIQAEDEEEVQERASSAISAKSNISSRSRKSETAPTPIEMSGEENKERTLSAMSSKSKDSLRSNKSKGHLEHVNTGETGKRASSTVSAKSEGSTDVELEQRASSAISAKSNASETSKRSNMSKVGEDEVKTLQVQDDDQMSAESYNSETFNTSTKCEEKKERTPSALSTKSKSTVKSNKSKAPELAAVKIVAEEHDLRSASAMSSKSISAKSEKSQVSDLVLEEPVETDEHKEGRTQSALSAKSAESEISVVTEEVAEDRSLSGMSSKSNASKRSKKSNSIAEHQTKERAESALSSKTNVSQKSQKSNASATADKADDKEKEERAPSAMSEQSCISTKSGISAKSESFTISDVSLQEPDDTEHEDKTPSVMSIKSSVSARSHKSTNSHGGPVEVEVHNNDILSSAISSISNISSKSGKSITPEATHSEKGTTSEPDIKERALSAMSAKSNSSVRTRTSKVSEIITDEQKVERPSSSKSLKSNVSGRSKKSNVSEGSSKNVVNEDKEKEERALSVLSSLSNVSERTKHSDIIPDVTGSYIEEKAPSVVSITSVKSKTSNASGVVPEETEITDNKDDEASVNLSNVLANSNVSTRSKSSFSEAEESEKRSISVLSSASAESKVSKADVEKISNRSKNQLSAKSDVSARSKNSVSEGEDNTPTNWSPVSGHSKASQADSNKCVCGAVKLSPIVSSPLSTKSAKSKISSFVTTSERALTPTSTSVSIGIVDDCEVDDDEGTTSVKSKTSASSETCHNSQKDLLESQLQMMKDRATQKPEARPKSFTMAKSNISERSKSKQSHCNATALDTNQRDEPSANDSVRQIFPTQEIRSFNEASSMPAHSYAGIAGQRAPESPDVTHDFLSICPKCSCTPNRGKSSTVLVTPTSPFSSASAFSDSGSGKNKNSAEIIDRPNSNVSNSSHLQVNDQKISVEVTVNSGGSHSGKSKKKCKPSQSIEEDRVRCHSATLSLTSTNRLSPSPPKSPKKSKKNIILHVGSKDSVPSQNVIDQSGQNIENKNIEQPKSNRPERTHNVRPDTMQNVTDKSEKGSKCRKRIGSSSSRQMMNDDAAELSPSCLPNSSPTEVVNEWLMKIPSETDLCDLEDEFHENFDTTEPLCTSHVPSVDENVHRDLKEYDVIKPEKQNDVDNSHLASAEGTVDKKSQENHAIREDDRQRIRPQAAEESKVLDSSVLVMKVLLSPTIDRCNSLPEVSPVYGRKLSTSAQGLLDCLAKLQLLDFGPSDEISKKAKYQDSMSMLKSLWLCDPKDQNFKDQQPLDKEFKARSSSGIDVNSGSTSSGKSSVLGGVQAQTKAECEGPDTLTKVKEVDETAQEERSETPESKCKSPTPYIASQARWTPVAGAKGPVEEMIKDDVTGSDETIRNNDSPRELMETPLSSNMSSGNYPQNKETETDHPEDSSSGSHPALQRPQLSKRFSQDPDPVWVLNLLNKLEKQFMTHYVNAMDEFKVRWNLDDNEQLDIMICELKDDVRKRIQYSVNRELKKIRGRAGRPRPPKEAMSRESTVQTEQRRRRLKVMRNQSVDPQPAKSEDEYTATGTDFSDQRSDDEYCPCDTCLKKKMVSKPVVPVETFNSAPVMLDFDLRRILQIKKSAPNNEKAKNECKVSKMDDAEKNVPLEVVKEEDDREVTDAFTAQESEKEDDEDRKSVNCEKIEDSFEKQSDTSLKKDMNEEVEIMSSMEVVEVGEISESNMTAEQQKEAEKENEEKGNNEADSENYNISGDVSDAMQVETERGKTKEWAQKEQTEHNRNNADESENGETVDDETAEEGEISEVKMTDESETAEDEPAEEGEISEVKTAIESVTAEDEPSKEGDTAQDETEEEGETSEVKFEEERETAEDETTEVGETSEAKTAEERETAVDGAAEEGERVEDDTGEEGETSEDKTAEESEAAEDEIAEESEMAEGETGEEGETSEVKTAEACETDEDETAEKSESAEDDTAEESETAEDKAAEEGDTSQDETAEKSESAEDDTVEESETAEDKAAEEGDTSQDETAEKSEAAEFETAADGDLSEAKTAKGSETAEDESAKKTEEDGENAESETAEEKTAENSETVANETAKDEHNSEDETAEKIETADDETAKDETKDETAEDDQTTEDESAEEDETANDDTQEEHETSINASVEDDKTAGDSDTASDEQTAEAKSATDGQSAERLSAEEDKTAKDKQSVETSARNRESSDHETTDELKPFVKDGQPPEAETADDIETADDSEGETIDEDTNSTDNKDELAEERVTPDDKSTDDDEETDRAERADEESTESVEDVSSKAEEDLTEDEENAEEDIPESHSELEEVKETVDHKIDVLSNPDDTECDDVIDLKADKTVAEEETQFKNEGDVVIDSIDEKDKESGKEDYVEEVLGDKGCHVADSGESAEGGDEAEDDTEPDMEIDEGKHNGNVQASESTLQPKQENGKSDKTTVTSFDVAENHNSVYDADVEDSETDVHNQIQELSSESESKPQTTVRKTFKMLIHTLAFLKPTATQRPKEEEEEEGDDEEEHEESSEESDNTEDRSFVEKEGCRKEKGELSDITEDTGEEENRETETGNTNKDYSESENALEKQFTKSSMESQSGSFDEVLDDQVKSLTISNHVTAKFNQ